MTVYELWTSHQAENVIYLLGKDYVNGGSEVGNDDASRAAPEEMLVEGIQI